ncbi:PDZ domain-containing protein [Tsuneonella amylolytica]|uniref:PDZ domain-containing protein n=1 Tax=Tsuneonella amylolytica TaxID=2338327 RepID=UPI000EAA32CF|nr:PDZ domain-containing protein [Tsuneonella amylolytica]
MKKLVITLAAFAATVPLTPVYADEPYAVTPSGRTEAIFDTGVTETSDKIANGCANVGWTLVNTTSTMVVCEARMSTMQSVLAALAMGNQYSTPPKQFLRFNIAGLGQRSRVQATGWMETQMAFGQVRTEEMTAANYHNNVMNFFGNLGAHFPPGTTFPNHAFIGSGFEPTSRNQGVTLTSIQPGSPAEKAGLQNGDVLVRLAKEKIKSGGDLLDGMRKAAKNQQYEVEIVRGGKPLKMTIAREFRAQVTDADLPDLPPLTDPAPVQAVMSVSPADELAKFAKLRDDGIITAEEFQKKKAAILGQ